MSEKFDQEAVVQAGNIVLEQEMIKQKSLALLLDDYRKKEGHTFTIKSKMGICESFLASVPLKWVYDNVVYAADLPLFNKNKKSDSKKITIDKYTQDVIMQRAPDWRRQVPLTLYLASQLNHKFPPILIVGYESWNYDLNHDNWQDGLALKRSIPIKEIDNSGYFLDLQTKETRYFALDGQHRLMAIQGLHKIIKEKKLPYKDKEGNEMSKVLTDKDIYAQMVKHKLRNDEIEAEEYLHGLLNDYIGVEIIPAVQINDTLYQAVDRVRNIFIDVNENAKKLTAGELTQIDTKDPFRVVARRIMVEHPLLSGNTHTTAKQLSENSHEITTLQSIVEVTKNYLGQMPKFNKWKSDSKDLDNYFNKLSDEEIDIGYKEMVSYYDSLSKLQSHADYLENSEKENKLIRKEEKWDHVLFRCIAQEALAKAIGFILNRSSNELNLEDIINILNEKENGGPDDNHGLKLRNDSTPWYGVVWNHIEGKMRNTKRYNQICERMFIYLFGGMESKEARIELRTDYREAKNDDSIELPQKWI